MTEIERFALDYLPVILFLGLGVILSLLFIVGAAILAPPNPDPAQSSAYACGFNAFDDARMQFDVRFYLVAILFIIFDLEVASCFRGLSASVRSAFSVSGRWSCSSAS